MNSCCRLIAWLYFITVFWSQASDQEHAPVEDWIRESAVPFDDFIVDFGSMGGSTAWQRWLQKAEPQNCSHRRQTVDGGRPQNCSHRRQTVDGGSIMDGGRRWMAAVSWMAADGGWRQYHGWQYRNGFPRRAIPPLGSGGYNRTLYSQ